MLELPEDAVREKRADILAGLRTLNWRAADELYAKTLSVIRSFMAQLCCATVSECARLRWRIRALIIANRGIAALTVVSAAVAVICSYWVFLATLGLALIWHFGINRLQTAANIGLAARVDVFSAMVMSDAQFREGVLAMIDASNDPDLSACKDSIAVFLQGLADTAEKMDSSD